MRALIVALSAVGLISAAVNGTVTNQTTGQKQANATVTLYKLGSAGPESIKSVKSDAAGKFEMSETPGAGPHLVQTAFDGVTYNHMLFPGSPSTGLALSVYNSSRQRGDAKVTTHMILLEPGASELNVSESVIWQIDGKLSFHDPAGGTFRFALPKEASKVKVMCSHPARNGVPIERAADKTRTPGVFTVDFPVKPGETRFDISYLMPVASAAAFSGKVIHGGGPVRFVVPAGVTLAGDSVQLVGEEPTTQASVYDLKKNDYTVAIQGTGALRGPERSGEEEDGGEGLKQIRPPVYDRFYPILGLAFFILTVGLLLLYRKSTPHELVETPAAAADKPKVKRKA